MNSASCQSLGPSGNFVNKSFLPSLAIIWIVFFSYTTSVALLFQYFVLPMVPSLNAGQGLFSPDSIAFHQAAKILSETISTDGWLAWRPWPPPNAYGNVAVLGGLYSLFGPNPSTVIPINACLHASSGVLLILIGRLVSLGRAARVGSIVAACLFVGFPSALNWYGQVHKDGYAILGFFLLLYSSLIIIRTEKLGTAFGALLISLAGIAVTVFVRPNNLQLFLVMAVGMAVLAVITLRKAGLKSIPELAFSILIVLSVVIIRPEAHQMESPLPVASSASSMLQHWKWTTTSLAPVAVDNLAKKMTHLRAFMAAYGVREQAGSMVDLHRMPSDLPALVAYLPRASVVGLFAPFPDSWFSKFSLARMVGVAETFAWYLIFPGLLFLIWQRRRDPVLWWLLGCSLAILTVESYITANLGTLHRIRYPFLFVFILLGTIGWANALSGHRRKMTEVQVDPVVSHPPEGGGGCRKISAVGAISAARRGLLVMALTGCLFLGLFIRDILLVRMLGLGADLDSFQLASFIPLFVTALLAVPLGPVLISQFVSITEREGKASAAAWVGAMSTALIGFFSALAIGVLGAVWFGFVGSVPQSMHASVGGMLIWFLPVVALSGTVVLGNAVLMANGCAVRASLAQLTVPLISVVLILSIGHQVGAVAAAAGLMLGQLVNYLLVVRVSDSLGYSIRPRFGCLRCREWAGQYVPLIATAALTSAAIPVGVYFASRLPEGSVAAFSMGAKVLQSITALMSAVLIAVVLPYFSRMFAANRLQEARQSLQLMISLGTLFAVPFSFGLFSFSNEIAALLFSGGKIGAAEIKNLGGVIQYGALQFPFYVVLIVLVKFTIAGRATLWVLIAALLGQAANIIGALALINLFGTAGLAMSMTISIAVSSLLLLLWATVKQHMSWMASAMVAISWLLFFTLAVCVHYRSMPGSIVCVLAFFLLMLGEIGAASQHFRERPA